MNQKATKQKTANKDLLLKKFGKEAVLTQLRSGTTCVSYNRVSSKDQMVNGNSLSWQNERIQEYAKRNNYLIKTSYGGTFESAKNDERKELKRMLDDIRKDKSISMILVYSYDRFSRSGTNGLYLVDNLRKLGVRVVAVTQEVDSSTPSGEFQESIYMLFSKLDNDMRKDKSMTGTKSILRKGYWPYSTPIGYTNVNPRTTADKHIYVINEKGQLLKQAFRWKASGKYTNTQIVDKLATKGLKVGLRNLAWIFANPFYCGYLTASILPNEIIEGKHPALIDEDTFLKVNDIKAAHPVSGIPKNPLNNELPLKVFARDAESESPFTGYLNKLKNIYYYKTRETGSKVNISANKLNNQFQELLTKLEYDKRLKATLKTKLREKLSVVIQDSKTNVTQNRKRISELKTQLDAIEERFVLGQISKEQHNKFSTKYNNDLFKLTQEITQKENSSSNLEKAIEKTLEIAQNLSQLWVAADFTTKQKLQYLIFPEGILYDKKTSTVRTTRVNELFRQIPLLTTVSEKKKKGNQTNDCLFGSNVGRTGFEPATPWSQTRYSTGLNYLPPCSSEMNSPKGLQK